MDALRFLQDLAVVLAIGGIAGWVFRHIGLSAVVGFLVAGIVIGPHTPPFALVSDLDRIQTLAQLGLVFLMFSVGMGLSLSRIRRLGAGMLIAVIVEAFLIFNGSRVLAAVLEWTETQGLFLAGILMVSSSAIISRVLKDLNLTHKRAGQLALGIAIMEDIVAIVMLTLLSSTARVSGDDPATVGRTVGFLLAFVTVLVVGGLLVMPRLLARVGRTGGKELQTVMLVGLLLGAALVSVKAGFSLALGAFLVGAIVADTPQREEMERAMQGLHDVFAAIFFVSIGMLVDVSAITEVWPMVLVVGAAALVGRFLAASIGLVAVGFAPQDAIRSGLLVASIGEFSFIIAELGIRAGILPHSVLTITVGASLLTAVLAPLLAKFSDPLSARFLALQPPFIERLATLYHMGLADAKRRGESNLLWQLGKRRVMQIMVSLLFVTGVLVVSGGALRWLQGRFPGGFLFPGDIEVGYWSVLTLVVLVPVFAMWRNITAMTMVIAEMATRGLRPGVAAAPVIERALQAGAGVLLALWIALLLPFDFSALWTVGFVVLVIAVLLMALRRQLIHVQSRVEIELRDALIPAEEHGSRARREWVKEHSEWNIGIHDLQLPDHALCAGKTLSTLELRSRFGCSVVGLERQGHQIPNPSPETELFPRDTLLLLGTPEQAEAVSDFLGQQARETPGDILDTLSLDTVIVPEKSAVVNQTLAELEIPRHTGVQIVGIEREGRRLLNPGPFQGLAAGDRLLVTGSADQIGAFRRWLAEWQPGSADL